MAQANNNAKVKAEAEAKAKAEAEREVRREQARVNAAAKLEVERLRKKNENEKKKSTVKPLSRNTLLRNLANLKEPALDPLRDAIMSLSDPSFLNKKFNADVYRSLPLRVKDFIGLSANQVTRAVIINKIIEAVKVGRERNAKEKNARENMKLAKTLVKAVNGLNGKPGASTGTPVTPKSKNAATNTGTPKPQTKTVGTNGPTPKPNATPKPQTKTVGTNGPTPKPNATPENNVLEVKITRTPTNNQMVSINFNNFNPNAKELQLTLPNNIKPKNVINSTVKLLRGIPIKNNQLNRFVLALKQSPKNSNVVNITNSNAPNSETMARILRNLFFGKLVTGPEIIYLEKGLTKIAEDAKKNNKPLALTWETQTNAKTKSGKNVSLQDWIGAVAKSDESGSTKSKPIGIFKGLFVGLTAAAVRAIITSRRAAKNPVMSNNPLSNNQQEMTVNPLSEEN
jgi:hypothetical protein